MPLIVALGIVTIVMGGIVVLYKADVRKQSSSAPTEGRHITMHCPVCRRPVEVPSWQRPRGHGMYPEELIALCRQQNGMSCGPFYDYIKGPLGPAETTRRRRDEPEEPH